MSTKTENLKLTKPAATDIVDISTINENMDIIDENLATRAEMNTIATRVNNLVANTGNSNTEIVDARVGYNNNTYSTLGEAIRKQFEGFKEENLEFDKKISSIEKNLDDSDAALRSEYKSADAALRSDYESADASIRTDLHTTAARIDKKISSLRLYRDDEGYLCEMEE